MARCRLLNASRSPVTLTSSFAFLMLSFLAPWAGDLSAICTSTWIPLNSRLIRLWKFNSDIAAGPWDYGFGPSHPLRLRRLTGTVPGTHGDESPLQPPGVPVCFSVTTAHHESGLVTHQTLGWALLRDIIVFSHQPQERGTVLVPFYEQEDWGWETPKCLVHLMITWQNRSWVHVCPNSIRTFSTTMGQCFVFLIVSLASY